MQDQLDVLKALADETRLRALCALRGGELCVCQLIALLELAPSTVSKHLSILRAARLVESRKDGRWMYYRLSREFRTPSTRKLLALMFEDFEGTARIVEDQKHLKAICNEGMESVCRRVF
ncbi:MAG: metalloregulator ArsR/SmtB family transcription factor [bacterium]